jgi:site-specific recombinase XerD
MAMTASSESAFKRNFETHLKHLRLKGLQPKTIEADARAIGRIGQYFEYRIEDLSERQLTEYFTDLRDSHSWSAVKLDLYGLKCFYAHVRHKPWVNVDLIKPPKAQRLPDILTVDEAKDVFMATRTLSYRVFYFTAYSLGLRLDEGLRPSDATPLIEAGVDLLEVQKILGHHSIMSTAHYTHLTTTTQSTAKQVINERMNGISIAGGNAK